MRYELMRPAQIRDAIARNLPVVLPLGVMEYHGEHLPVGMDLLAVTRLLERLEDEAEIVLLPAFAYGTASHAVAPPEGNGTLDVAADHLLAPARDLFRGLLRVGFRNVHAVIHHQTERFAEGMPTDLAFRLAARQAVLAFLEIERGKGWWGRDGMADYYAQARGGADPLSWIRVHPLLSAELIRRFPFDHAGQGETSLMLALCPGTVAMDQLGERHWYTQDARHASAGLGEQGCRMILDHLRQVLGLAA
jgi:creatinine amidohydrolase/Fe(II)-dependent formamide hydrolase-like protein